MRRLVTAGLLLVGFAAIWSVGWFALAAWARGQVDVVLSEAAERGIDVACSGRDVVGFPFALRIGCTETAVAERASGTRAELAGLTGGASIFSPTTANIDLGSPAEVNSPNLPGPATFRWDEADVDVGMGLNGPRSVSFDATDFAAELPIEAIPEAAVAAETAAAELAPADDGGTQAEFSFTGLALSTAGTVFPPFDGSGGAWLSMPPRALLSGRAGVQAPVSARDINVLLSSGAARLQAQGDVSLDAEGVLDGTIALKIAGTEDLPALIAALPPEFQKMGNAVAGGLIAFGSASTLDGAPASEIVVAIERGRAKVGPVEVTLPRLPL